MADGEVVKISKRRISKEIRKWFKEIYPQEEITRIVYTTIGRRVDCIVYTKKRIYSLEFIVGKNGITKA